MPETQLLGNIRYVTDTDSSIYDLGEVEGGFDSTQLRDYIAQYGTDGYDQLIRALAYMVTNATNEYVKFLTLKKPETNAAQA